MQNPRYTIEQYLNIRTAYLPGFSPRGDKLVFLSDVTDVPQLWQVGIDFERHQVLWPDQLTFGADRVMGASYSPVDEDLVLFGHDFGGNENMQLFLLSLKSGAQTLLSSGYEKAMHAPGGWAPDGQSFLFAANRRHPGLFDLYVQPLDGDAKLVWQNTEPGFLLNLAFSPDGKRAVLTRMASSFQHDLIEVNLENGEGTLLSPEGVEVSHTAVTYSGDGRSLLVVTDLDSDFLYLARFDLETCKYTPVVQVEADVDAVQVSPDYTRLAYALNRDGNSDVFLLDLETSAQRGVPQVGCEPGMLMGNMMGTGSFAFSPDSKHLALTYTGACCPADIYLWDLESDQVHPVTRSSMMGIPRAAFAAPELIHYPTFDDDPDTGEMRRIPAWLYRPAGSSGKLPVVIQVHGGPEGQTRTNFQAVIQYLVHHGYAVLAPNVRGSSGYGNVYCHLDDVKQRMDSVADLAHAALWVKDQPGLDGDRIAVIGGSYGGFMVLSSLTTYPDLWAAGVDIVGISNFVTFLENTSEYRRAHREAEYGSLARDREFLEGISPSNHLEKIQAPLLVIHGTNDPRVPLSETLQLVEKLEARGVPVESMIFDDEGHGLVKLKNKLKAYPAVVKFLNEHLGK